MVVVVDHLNHELGERLPALRSDSRSALYSMHLLFSECLKAIATAWLCGVNRE